MRAQLPFEARCAEVLREAAAQRHVALMVGNRDFLLAADMLRGLRRARRWPTRRCCAPGGSRRCC